MKIIECVPNFSEGKNEQTLQALQDSLKGIKDVSLLSFEPNADYNRVVVTIAGNEAGVLEGALALSRTAAKYIDMTTHKGGHPRLGAIDVVPFIPIKDATTEDCVHIANEYGRTIGKELQIPVYLYEAAAKVPQRKNLADIRKGEYEALEAKLALPEWTPDYGSPFFNPKLGGTVTGSRFFLVAYNVNIRTKDVSIATEIAESIREIGKAKKDENGRTVKVDGKVVRIPGRLKCVKAMGVELPEYGITQVSVNLTNYTVTSMHTVFEEVKKEAERYNAEVSGSEIVGLVPLEAIRQAGVFYSGNGETNEEALVAKAVSSLGLSDLAPFDPKKKIIEYMI